MRTQAEIIARIEERRPGDVLGFEWPEYASYLEFKNARSFLKEGTVKADWKVCELSKDNLLAAMLDYMPFAWEKANNCRGISANRSVMHFVAWTWLMGDDDFAKKIQDEYENNYHIYGKPTLEMICKHYGWDFSQWDDGRRSNVEY